MFPRVLSSSGVREVSLCLSDTMSKRSSPLDTRFPCTLLLIPLLLCMVWVLPVFTSALAAGDGWLELCSALGSAPSQLFLIDLSSFVCSSWAIAVLQHLLSESGFVLLHLLLNSKIAVSSFFSRSLEEGSFLWWSCRPCRTHI